MRLLSAGGGLLECVALQSAVLLQLLRKVPSLTASALVSQLRVRARRVLQFEELAILLRVSVHSVLLVRVAALVRTIRVLATPAVPLRDVVVPKLLHRHNFGGFLSPVQRRPVDHGAGL